jgi:hypothetical protein
MADEDAIIHARPDIGDDDLDEIELLVTIEDHPSESDAADAARRLLERGIGATVAPTGGDGGAAFAVQVLSHDAARATELLDHAASEADDPRDDIRDGADGGDPADAPLGTDSLSIRRRSAAADEPMKIEKAPAPWKQFALIWLAAMILLPLAAFAFTYFAMSR